MREVKEGTASNEARRGSRARKVEQTTLPGNERKVKTRQGAERGKGTKPKRDAGTASKKARSVAFMPSAGLAAWTAEPPAQNLCTVQRGIHPVKKSTKTLSQVNFEPCSPVILFHVVTLCGILPHDGVTFSSDDKSPSQTALHAFRGSTPRSGTRVSSGGVSFEEPV